MFIKSVYIYIYIILLKKENILPFFLDEGILEEVGNEINMTSSGRADSLACLWRLDPHKDETVSLATMFSHPKVVLRLFFLWPLI